MRKIRIIPIKVISILDKKFDLDKDKVPDYKDCKPFNPRYHSFSQTMGKRVEDLDIEVRDEIGGPRKYYHIMSKEAKKYSPKGTQQVISVLSKYPNVVGKMEREAQHKPILWRHFSEETPKGESLGLTSIEDNETNIITRTDKPSDELKEFKNKQARHKLAETILHELRHAEQTRPSEYRRSNYESKYDNNPEETDARVFAYEEVEKKYKKEE